MPTKTQQVVHAVAGNGRRMSWSISVTAVVSIAFAVLIYSADNRYLLAGEFAPRMQQALIEHELAKLRVELAVLKSKKNLGQLSPSEKTDLEIKEQYRIDLTNQLDRQKD